MSYANRILGSIPYGTLIGAPMTAAVQAQALAAQSSIDFIRSVGFTGNSDNEEFGDVRMVVFKYKRRSNENTLEDVTLTVPILTIVPIPYLRIDDMTIDFTSKLPKKWSGNKSVIAQWTPMLNSQSVIKAFCRR